MEKYDTIGAKRAQEVCMVLRPKPTIPAKAVANAPVVHTPMKQAFPTPISAKDAQKVNEASLFELHNVLFQCKSNVECD